MGLDGAGYLLLFHAVAVLSGVVLLQQGLLLRPLVLGVLSGWVLGSALFAGDIALRAFVGYPLFPMAAPTGGVALILAWLALAVAAILALLHSWSSGPNDGPMMAIGICLLSGQSGL
jgi:uncharacterized membrane protein YgdD (TMEM256/DUF423 family)